MSAAAETGLFLDGLRCAGCVHQAESALRDSPGVLEASVNYTNHRALVRYDSETTNIESLVRRIETLGFEATPYDPEALERPQQRDARRALVRLLVAAFLAGNLMLVAGALYIGGAEGLDPATRRALRWLGVALSLPAVTWCAAPFWRGAWKGLRRGVITIDLPVVLGISTAFATNIAGTLAETRHVYADSATMIVFLILLGRTLERNARARASAAVDRITALTPASALRRRADGVLERVEPRELAKDDRVVVASGEVVPADGRIVRGESEFDESLLTGESAPVVHLRGADVVGGTLNLIGEVEVEIERPVNAGTLARLAALLERAQTERPRVQRLADRVAAVFAPSVIAAALLTAGFWLWTGAAWLDAALSASAVLIVACPCALGLATPAAVSSAIGRAASLGILVKSGEALERCARIDHCILDKTGTVTEGRLAIAALEPSPGVETSHLLARAQLAEGAATHPIARALAAASGEPAQSADSTDSATDCERRTIAGRGVVCTPVDGSVLRVGSRSLLADAGIAISRDLDIRAAKLADEGHSLAWVAEGQRALGAIGLLDRPREDAREAIARLGVLDIATILISGDHAGAVRMAARTAGIDRFESGSSPEDKVARVRAARDGGARVLAVGDGVNDAAALAAADVGVAMASGSDVTLHAADIVIRAPHLGAVPDAIELARATLARIRENLTFAVLYNVAAVPLAAAGLLSPFYAAIAMSASSLIVTANAVRLQRWKPRT